MKNSSVPPKGLLECMLPCLLLVLGAAGLGCFSFQAGGFASDLAGDPDEAAHAVTALMVRDYLADGLGTPPMQFAKAYYEDFPRVALGHYPPLYYFIAAPFLLMRPSVDTLMALQVMTLAGLATLTTVLGRRMVRLPLAIAAGGGMLLLPVALKLSQHVMADILLALMCLWSVILWADYLRSPSLRRALVWGGVAAAAILTKGSGIGLCLLPPLGTLLHGRWRLMLNWTWWCSALPVAMLAGPWMLYSTKISKEGMTGLSPWQYLGEAVPFYFTSMPEVFGWPLVIFSCLSLGGVAAGAWRHGVMREEPASLIAMTAGMTAVLLLVPVGVTTRYMLTLAPSVMLGCACAANWAAVAKRRFLAACLPGGLLLCALVPLASNSGPPRKHVHGFGDAVLKTGIPTGEDKGQHWLVASDPRGEGAVIAAAAFACPRRSPSPVRVHRGSKELARSDWMGRGYQASFPDAESLLKHLDARDITRVFLDLSAADEDRKPHERLLESALAGAVSRWKISLDQPINRQAGPAGHMLVYERL